MLVREDRSRHERDEAHGSRNRCRLPPARDLRTQCLERLDVDFREGGEWLDRVGQDLDRYAGANRQRRLLKPLASFGAEGVGADQAGAVGEQGQEPVAVGIRARVRLGLRQFRQSRCSAEGAVGRASGCRLRVGEDDPRDGVVVGLAWLAQDVRRDDVALVLPDVGERPDAGDITDRPQPLARAQPRIDRDASSVGVDADGVQSDVVDARAPTRSDQEPLATQLGAGVQVDHVLVVFASRCGRPDVEEHLDAVSAQHLGESVTEGSGLAREKGRSAFDERDLATEAADCLRHLDTDRPATKDEHPRWHRLHPGHLPVGPDPLQAAQARDRRDQRVGTIGEDDVVGGMAHAVHVHHPGASQPSSATKQVDAVVRQPAFLPGVRVVRDHEVAPGEGCLDVDAGRRGRLVRGVRRLARTQQRLGRDARPVRALTADQLVLDEGDPQTACGECSGAVLSG